MVDNRKQKQRQNKTKNEFPLEYGSSIKLLSICTHKFNSQCVLRLPAPVSENIFNFKSKTSPRVTEGIISFKYEVGRLEK